MMLERLQYETDHLTRAPSQIHETLGLPSPLLRRL